MTAHAAAPRQKSPPFPLSALVAPARWKTEVAAIPLLGHRFGQISMRRPQTRLTVSQPGDPHEQEAERMADHVMHAGTLTVSGNGGREDRDAQAGGVPLAPQVMRAPSDAPPPASPTPAGDPNAPTGDPNVPITDPGSTTVPLNGGAAGGGATNISINSATRSLSAPNLSQLWDVMTRSGTRESASVLPKLQPSPQYEYDGNNRVTKAVITVVENKEMPQWTELPQQCPPIQAEWNRFFGILDTHENNHIAIDKKHFTNLHTRLIGKEQSVAWKIVDDEVAAADQENSDYDTKSGHGVNEGANINSAVQCAPEKIKSTSAGGPGSDNTDPNADPGSSPALPPTAQAKLAVSRPGDPQEQEAERVADQVLRMPSLVVQRACAGPGQCDCPKCRAEHEQQQIARAADGDNALADDAGPQVAAVVGRGGGQGLGDSTRAFMEPRFGHDFSKIRIHTDDRAARSAASVQALAYTVGNDVVFGAGQYAPGTSSGDRLLAHELTHTIQQGQTQPLIQRVSPYPGPASQGPPPAPSTLPPIPGSPTAPGGPVPPGQHDGQLVATWGWAWKTKLNADRRDARDFDSLAKASAFGASIAPAAIFQEDGKFVVYHLKYTALHSFTYDNAKSNEESTDCDMQAVTPVLAIITEDGVPILPHQLIQFDAWEDREPTDDSRSPMGAKDTLEPGEDPFAAHKDVFGPGLGSVTDEDAFVNQFEVAMRDAAISALDRSQRDAEQKQKDMPTDDAALGRGAGSHAELQQEDMGAVALPAGDKDKIASVAKRLAVVEAKLDETRFMAMPRRGPNAEEEHEADEAAKEAKVKELTEERAKIRLEYPLLSQVDAADFLKKDEKEQVQMLGGAANEVLKNIKITRDNVLTGSLKLWAVPSLVQTTQAGLGVTDDGRKKWVAEKVRQVDKDAKEVQQALGVFQIAFSVAAVALGGPVGAAFAVGALGVSMADALITTQQYAQDQAAAGTDVNKDKALVPSDLTGRWFTLVVAWVGVGLSYADAAYWVRNIKVGAVTVEEAATALAKNKNVDEGTLKSAAKGADAQAALDSANLSGEVHFETPQGTLAAGEDASKLEGGDKFKDAQEKLAQAEGKEAKAASELTEAKGSASVGGGHEVKMTGLGAERCSAAPCPVFTDFWQNELERHPSMAERVKADVAMGKATPQQAADALASLDKALQDIEVMDFEQWAAGLESDTPKFTQMKQLPANRADIANTVPTEAQMARIQENITTMKADGRLPQDYVYTPPSAQGFVIPADMAKKATALIGTRLSENAAVMECWEEAVLGALEGKVLGPENYEAIYKSAQGRFWRQVEKNSGAKAFFTEYGFVVEGGISPALDVDGVARREISLGLDHMQPKATGDNWQHALDGDKIQLLMQADNTKLSHVEKSNPSLRR